MKVLYKKKIYNGMVELRDYEVQRAIAMNKPIKIIVGEEHMILTPAVLRKGKTTGFQHSKYNIGQTYALKGYEWKGVIFRDKEIAVDMSVRHRLAEEFRKKYGTNHHKDNS